MTERDCLLTGEIYCVQCGTRVYQGDQYCTRCGAKQRAAAKTVGAPTNKWFTQAGDLDDSLNGGDTPPSSTPDESAPAVKSEIKLCQTDLEGATFVKPVRVVKTSTAAPAYEQETVKQVNQEPVPVPVTSVVRNNRCSRCGAVTPAGTTLCWKCSVNADTAGKATDKNENTDGRNVRSASVLKIKSRWIGVAVCATIVFVLLLTMLIPKGQSDDQYMNNVIEDDNEAVVDTVTAPPVFQETLPIILTETDTEAEYKKFLKQHLEYRYYALLDINADGIPEMLATPQIAYYGTATACTVDVFMWMNGRVTLVYDDLLPKYVPLAYDPENEWIQSSTGGTGGGGEVIIYIDDDLNIRKETVETYLDLVSDEEHIYYNGQDITGMQCEDYDRLIQKMKSGKPQDIVFRCCRDLDGTWPVSFEKKDLVEISGELFLTFTIYTANYHSTQDVLMLQPGDRIVFDGKSVTVQTIDIYTWEHDGEEMYRIWINDVLGLSSDLAYPARMVEIEELGDGFPRYKEVETLNLKICEDAVFYDKSKNEDPAMPYKCITYSKLMEYFAQDYYGGTPVSTILIIEDNQIKEIWQDWLS